MHGLEASTIPIVIQSHGYAGHTCLFIDYSGSLSLYTFQRQQSPSGGTIRLTRPANCGQPIPPCSFLNGFPDPSQFAAARLTHYSSKPRLPSDSSDSSRPRIRLLLAGDVHTNPGPATKYPCPVCARNVTSRG